MELEWHMERRWDLCSQGFLGGVWVWSSLCRLTNDFFFYFFDNSLRDNLGLKKKKKKKKKRKKKKRMGYCMYMYNTNH